MRRQLLATTFICILAMGIFSAETCAQFRQSARDRNPFSSSPEPEYKLMKTVNKEFDLSKIGGLGREETMAMFEKIWREFRRTNQLAPDGNFFSSESPNTPDTLEAKARFYVFVKQNNPELTLIDRQDCPKCRGRGRYYANGTEYDCDTCDTWGVLANKYVFKLTHTGELPAGISKYLPAEASKPVMKDGGKETGSQEDALVNIAEKHISEIVRLKFDDKNPKGFGVERLWFSSDDNQLRLNLKFRNAEALKAYGVRLKIELLAEGRTYSGAEKLAVANDAELKLDSEDSAKVSYSAFFYPSLDISKAPTTRTESFAAYSSVLKIIKRTASIIVKIEGVTPKQTQDAVDIDKISVWFAQREGDSAKPTPSGQGAQKKPGDNGGNSYGSGMVFTQDGHIFTNHHVIADASKIYVVVIENGQMTAKHDAVIVKKDPRTDLAILQCKDWKAPAGAPANPPPIVPSSECKLGAEVFVLGYPLPGTVSSNVKYTKGDVSDMSGLDDDSSKIQHTAPIQPGNSGGPMALKDGRIVGVIVSSLSATYALKSSGALPQGVNFSVKSDYLLTLASIAGIKIPSGAPSSEPVEHVKNYTVQIMCEK